MNWPHPSRVVAPIDFSDESIAALETALQIASDASHLEVVYVLPVLEPTEAGVIWHTIDNDSRRQHAEQAFRERLPDAKYKAIKFNVVFGDPGHEIADFAEGVGAELIVLSSHGRTGLTRLLIGSVAEKVVRLAHCPVLVLKKKAE